MGDDSRGSTVAGISSEAVKNATGRHWDEWLSILDDAGAVRMEHADIARLLVREHQLTGWWSQMVATGYEQERGLREPNQTARGFRVSVSRTVRAPVGDLWRAWDDERRRIGWLGQAAFRVRHAARGRTLRLDWTEDDTDVVVHFYEKGPDRSQVVVQHGRLADGEQVEQRRSYWRQRLDALRARLEG